MEILPVYSAGGIGVLLNVDKVQEKINENAPNSTLKAIIDSSWILELPYMSACKKIFKERFCSISKMFSQTIE